MHWDGIVGSLLGAIIGGAVTFFGQLYIRKRKLNEEHKVNVNLLNLILIRQLNEFENIRRYFEKFKFDSLSYFHIPEYLISTSSWRVDRKEITSLYTGEKAELKLIYTLSLLDRGFKDILEAVNDRNKLYTKLDINGKKSKFTSLLQIDSLFEENEKVDQNTLKKFTDDIYQRIEKIDFKSALKELQCYIERKHPGSAAKYSVTETVKQD